MFRVVVCRVGDIIARGGGEWKWRVEVASVRSRWRGFECERASFLWQVEGVDVDADDGKGAS
jgi:hypothetical protein